ncbi:MAG: MFS transporter, partial [Planctomycetes bacterium]|nr:MFS transporter [Planctomycetota bacterium]
MNDASRRTALLLVFATVCIDLLGFGLVLPLLPIYGRELTVGFSPESKGWILGLLMSCFSVMQFLFAPFWGRFSDRLGRRPVLLVSLAGSTFFYALFGLASQWHSLAWMFVARIGAGIACASIPTAQAYIADVTPPEKRTHGMALIGAAFGLGFTLGPLIGA